jgi:hypothetical protein
VAQPLSLAEDTFKSPSPIVMLGLYRGLRGESSEVQARRYVTSNARLLALLRAFPNDFSANSLTENGQSADDILSADGKRSISR